MGSASPENFSEDERFGAMLFRTILQTRNQCSLCNLSLSNYSKLNIVTRVEPLYRKGANAQLWSVNVSTVRQGGYSIECGILIQIMKLQTYNNSIFNVIRVILLI